MAKDGLTMAFDPDIKVILAAYETEDDLGKIIRTHFFIEQQIDQLVAMSSARVDKKSSYFSKLNLLRAMGVPEKICAACEAINDLRNVFAHNPKATVANTKDTSEKFLNAVQAFFPKLPESHGEIVQRRTRVTHDFSYKTATQAQRVVVAASFLAGVIGVLPKLYKFGPTRLATMSGFQP
jgi:hypothetical protein